MSAPAIAPSVKPHNAPMAPPVMVGAKPMKSDDITSTSSFPQPQNLAAQPRQAMPPAQVMPAARANAFMFSLSTGCAGYFSGLLLCILFALISFHLLAGIFFNGF